MPTQPQPYTRITWFDLGTLHGDELVEVLVQGRRLTRAAMQPLTARSRRWRTMPGRIMLIADVPEEPDLVFARKERECKRVYRRVSVALVEEAAAAVQVGEEGGVGLGAEEVQARNLEVAEELAVVVFHARVRVEEPVDVGVRVDEMRVLGDEVAGDGPQRGEGAGVVQDGHVEAVDKVVFGEKPERVVGDVAEEMHVRLDPPVPVVRGEGRVLVEESRLPADHRVVAQHVSLADPNGA